MVDKKYTELKKDLRTANRKVAGDPKKIKLRKLSFKKSIKGFRKKPTKGFRKQTLGRETSTRRVLTALGASQLKPRGAGRPSGSGKYQLMGYKDVYEYRKAMAQQRGLMRMQRDREIQKLKRRGLSEEQINRLQLARTLEQHKRAIVPDSRKAMMQQAVSVADDERDFAKFRAEKTVSPNTQRLLTQMRRIQNKGEVDNIEQQRRIYEKRLIAEQGNLLKTKNLFGKDSNTLNILEMEGNILTAQSVFKEDPEDNILKTKRLNIMQTREGGNNLQIF